jgi:hypothetical protein
MRKHLELVISEVSIPQINLEVGTTTPQVVPAPTSAASAPDNQKYHVDDINEPTPCTLLYVKGRTLRTIEVVDAIMMATHITHGQPILLECPVVEVTTIREGHEFEDLDYPDEEEGTEKLNDATGTFILWPHKDIIKKPVPHILFRRRADRMRVLQLLKIPYTPLPHLLLSQIPPKTTPPPENPPYTQHLKHHSLKPPHTTPPLQNLPTEQAPQQHSPPSSFSETFSRYPSSSKSTE